MAPARGAAGAEKKGRKRKTKSRTKVEVSSSSESDSDAPQQSNKKPKKLSQVPVAVPQNGDIPMTDAHDAPSSNSSASASASPAPASVPAPVASTVKALPKDPEEFSTVYLKKITSELADDLVKVRDAQDFKESSLKMLIHALKQGSSIYSAEEKRRVVSATG